MVGASRTILSLSLSSSSLFTFSRTSNFVPFLRLHKPSSRFHHALRRPLCAAAAAPTETNIADPDQLKHTILLERHRRHTILKKWHTLRVSSSLPPPGYLPSRSSLTRPIFKCSSIPSSSRFARLSYSTRFLRHANPLPVPRFRCYCSDETSSPSVK